MHATPLPCGAQELAAHGLHDAPVGVADDEPGAGEAALEEPPHKGGPGVALVVAGRQIEPQHTPLARGRHPDRHGAR